MFDQEKLALFLHKHDEFDNLYNRKPFSPFFGTTILANEQADQFASELKGLFDFEWVIYLAKMGKNTDSIQSELINELLENKELFWRFFSPTESYASNLDFISISLCLQFRHRNYNKVLIFQAFFMGQ